MVIGTGLKRRNILFLILLQGFLGSIALSGQPEALHFHSLSPVQNLTSGSYNYYIFKDAQGFVWISSINGLNRYDGQRVIQYHSDENDPHSLADHNIQGEFFEDSEKGLWFCTVTAIHRYDRKFDRFDRFYINTEDVDSISKAYRLLYLDTLRRELWVKIQGKLYIQPIDTARKAVTVGDYYLPNKAKLVRPSPTSSLFLFIPKEDTLEIRKITSEGKEIFDGSFPRLLKINYRINAFLLEDENTLWMGTDKGLKKLLLNGFIEIPYDQFNGENIGEVSALVKQEDHRLVIATKGNGIFYFDPASPDGFIQKLYVHHAYHIDEFNAPVERMYLDDDQNLWIHIPGKGILFTSLKKKKFKAYLQSIGEDNSLGSYVRAFTQDQMRRTYCLTKEGIEIYRQNGETLHFEKHIDHESFGVTQLYPFAIFTTGRQLIWTGSSSGMHTLDLERPDPVRKISTAANNFKPSTDFTHFIRLSNGKFLASTTDSGIIEIDEEHPGKWQPVLETSEVYTTIFEDSRKNVFVSNETKCIEIYHQENDQLIRDTSLVLKAFVTGILEDCRGPGIWVSTLQGLYRIDNEGGKFYMEKNTALADIILNGMLQDSLGNLWLSTNTALIRYHPGEDDIWSFTIADGLQSPEFNFWAAYETQDHHFIFGGVNGINIFNPYEIGKIDVEARPVITDIRINGKKPEYSLQCENTGVRNISEIKKIKLRYWENHLTFDFAALEYSDPSSVQFKYKMTAGSKDTFFIAPNSTVQFPTLPPGKYTLEVMASNSDGEWSSRIHQLEIVIRPPWWRTWVAYIIYGILFLAVINAFYRNREKQIRKAEEFRRKEAEYKQLVAETETAVLRLQMNPHFIFNSMNSISSYILERDIETANDYLNRFARLMRMILKFAGKEYLAVSQEIELLEQYLNTEAMRFEDLIDYEITLSDDLDPDEYIVPTMILQPFVENAIWHGLAKKSGVKKVIINFRLEDSQLVCSVADNGIGRNAATQSAPGHESKAIAITKRRLELLEEKTGQKTDLEIMDLKDETGRPAGTRVNIRIPVL